MIDGATIEGRASGMTHRSFTASDGYEVHVGCWPAAQPARGHVVILHGVQSHSGWYGSLGRALSAAGYQASFPDRRGSGPNSQDRGHAPSAGRLVADLAEWVRIIRSEGPGLPVTMGGISWGGKLALILTARHPELVDGLALICPGLLPRIGVSFGEKARIALALFTDRRKTFPIPLSDPALFTGNPEAQAYIAADPLGLREGTAGLMATSFFIDRMVSRAPGKVRQPSLLMIAGRDRIVDNARTLRYFDRLATSDRTVIEYPEAHHTLEFEPDPSRYAGDLIAWIRGHVERA
ncbi:Alpha/beta hydrolase family protein [Aquisphaera giovannonii]|uniref:Alpha/beta hydrolase family protein n=1 Tax=Aquisphaera giovannonii TaxID=406548 RepID=A0A5B9W1B6_9BACT|nr:alpha/beta fold hydrolase [Aquisphaera giovannonii]QEH33991.1 Alpha/beta hydrolase family protein [Aquisphaera giovannonii]